MQRAGGPGLFSLKKNRKSEYVCAIVEHV
jgi:hypothetical protein